MPERVGGDGRRIREGTAGCRLLVLCATALEAAPVMSALVGLHGITVATKKVVAGWLAADRDGPPLRVALAIGGCDKANTAHLLTCLLEAMEPAPVLVLQIGIAGALPLADGTGARLGDLVLATREIYGDTGSSSPQGWLSAKDLGLPLAETATGELYNVFPLDEGLVEEAAAVLEAGTGGVALPAADGGGDRPCRVVKGPFVTVSRISGLQSEGEKLAERWGAVAESMEGAAAAHMCSLYEVPFLEVRAISNMAVDRDRASWRLEEAVAAAGKAALLLCRAFGSPATRSGQDTPERADV